MGRAPRALWRPLYRQCAAALQHRPTVGL